MDQPPVPAFPAHGKGPFVARLASAWIVFSCGGLAAFAADLLAGFDLFEGSGASPLTVLSALGFLLPVALSGGLFAGVVAAVAGFPVDPFGSIAGIVRKALPSLGPALVGGGLFLALAYHATHYVFAEFRNQELGALVVAISTLALALVSAFAASLAARGLARVTRPGVRGLAGTGGGAVVALAVLVHLGLANRDGLEQLGAGPLAAPVVFVAGLVGGAFLASRARPRPALIALVSLALAGVVASSLITSFDPAVPSRVGRDAFWSGRLVAAIHGATDFDGDGHSSFLGGDDCAPFDPDVHPGAKEILGDGIDNNCVGGDATARPASAGPVWSDLPAGWKDYNLLIVTSEAVRADHVSFLGYKRKTTPSLDALAKDAFVMSRFYSTAAYTRFCLPSLLTSRYPSEIAWGRVPGKKLSIHPSNPYLPEVLRDAGFATGAIMSSFNLFTLDGEKWGFERGFETYDSTVKVDHRGGTIQGFTAAKQADLAVKFVDAHASERFFLWIHFLDPHYKYQDYPGSPDFGDEDVDRYDREIWGVDHELGRILAHLKAKKLADRTIVLFLGDHGEEFREHGKRFHGSNLYDPQVRVPMLLYVPGLGARRSDTVASFRDIAPTLANLLGVKAGFDAWKGRNLLPLLRGEAVADEPIVLELWASASGFKDYQAAVVDWPWKLHFREKGPVYELYNLEQSPNEDVEVFGDGGDAAARLTDFLVRYEESVERKILD